VVPVSVNGAQEALIEFSDQLDDIDHDEVIGYVEAVNSVVPALLAFSAQLEVIGYVDPVNSVVPEVEPGAQEALIEFCDQEEVPMNPTGDVAVIDPEIIASFKLIKPFFTTNSYDIIPSLSGNYLIFIVNLYVSTQNSN
jgi:hypothetical protein